MLHTQLYVQIYIELTLLWDPRDVIEAPPIIVTSSCKWKVSGLNPGCLSAEAPLGKIVNGELLVSVRKQETMMVMVYFSEKQMTNRLTRQPL